MTLLTKEIRDLMSQEWILGSRNGEFTGEIVSKDTLDHICWCDSSIAGKSKARMIIAAKEIYKALLIDYGDDDYKVPGAAADRFLLTFENFVQDNAGW